MPEIFFNDRLIGGFDELEKLEQEGKLESQIRECLDGPSVDFPPPYRKPKSEEFLKVSLNLIIIIIITDLIYIIINTPVNRN